MNDSLESLPRTNSRSSFVRAISRSTRFRSSARSISPSIGMRSSTAGVASGISDCEPSVGAGVAAFGAWFDRQRGALGAALRIEGDSLLLRFAKTTVRVPALAIEAIGFGAPGGSGGPAPETFWRGDFGPVARSHLVVVRFTGEKLPRRVIVPEASPLHAQAAAARLHRLAASCRPR